MGDSILEMLAELIAHLEDPDALLFDQEGMLAAAREMDQAIRSERTLRSEAVERGRDLEDRNRTLMREVGVLQGDAADLRAKLSKLTLEVAAYRKDQEVAATDMAIPVPEPGTWTARLLAANVLLRRDRDALRSELEDLRRRNAVVWIVASEAVAILQRLHQEDGLDLDFEIVFFMARVRVGSGGGCGVCPLRETIPGGGGASECGHPGAEKRGSMGVTMSQANAGPPPGWCPFIIEAMERSDGGTEPEEVTQ